ncbi:MAG: molybdopterin-guanine dinucleotide biosynthesis protein B [Deltaproteobacteria bacterium]|nr:molybdopterin-guanine dinucleotide biosynthesis protein B [Deltaproteobacteria bacterium]
MIKQTPIICVAGKSESGKTTLIEKLIPELKKRGYRIGSIKHTCQAFDIDKKGKDSWRHRKAGADIVVIASTDKIAMIKDNDCKSLDCLKKYFNGVDLIIVEGYNKENIHKIEIVRKASGKEPLCLGDSKLIAVVTDSDTGYNVPEFGLEEIDNLADFIENKYL